MARTPGRYKLLERAGQGRCGVVSVAAQTRPVRRRVALKGIKLGMDPREVIARFEAERQALAMMDHPNLARVLDAGTTELGRPDFVMEVVHGILITDYCDQSNPDTKGRLRDNKVCTQLHQFIGTPAYMSPEQTEMSGRDIDMRQMPAGIRPASDPTKQFGFGVQSGFAAALAVGWPSSGAEFRGDRPGGGGECHLPGSGSPQNPETQLNHETRPRSAEPENSKGTLPAPRGFLPVQ